MSQFDSFSLTSSENLKDQHQESSAESFVRAVLYTGIQTPINGAAQLFDRSGENLPNIQLINPPKEQGLAANLGSAAASTAHVAAMLYLGHKIGGPVTDLSAFAKRGAANATLGAAYGGLLTPVDSNGNFAQARIENAVAGGVGMAGMSLYSSFYRDTLGKGVPFLDAPFYHMMNPAAMAGVALIADSKLRPEHSPNSVFLPSARLRPLSSYMERADRNKQR